MSLADQSQQWYPTSVQVTVFQARNLRIKGKNGTNDAYAIMQVAKDKFSTSVAEKCVSPVWKEEASFDLPLFHHGNAERCTLRVLVMHRALVGPDKLLGQAVINLLDLNDNKARNKTEWFTLLDKTGKKDKERGEVLLDIQFLRNNMTASMFDLSATEKPRSRMGKLKDKIRGKKDSTSDSASAIVPPVSQAMTDSEGEEDGQPDTAGGKKKKSKLKSLFVPKSNLQRNVSQSMSTLGSLPEKNSALSGSRSSGLNIPEGKKKFKFLTHKRTGSSDSKASHGSKQGVAEQGVAEQGGVCINGSHVYVEGPQVGSTLSLHSSDAGSSEDLHTLPERSEEEQDRKRLEEEQERMRQEEEEQERMRLERMRQEELERKRQEEEQERKRLEEEQERRRQEEEEQERKRLERMRQEELERMRQEELERMRQEEEQERKRQEEEQERKRQEEEQERMRMEEEQERKRLERMRQEELERMRQEELERKRQEEEQERKMQEEEQERKRLERMRQEELERMRQEELERKRQEEEQERKMQEEEQERKRLEEEQERKRLERMRQEELERMRMEEEEQDRKRLEEEQERKRLEEEQERMRQEELERMRMEEEEQERKRLEEEQERKRQERMRQEELERIRMDEEEQERMRMEEEQEKKRLEEEQERKRLEELERIRIEEEEEERKRLDKARKDEELRQQEDMKEEFIASNPFQENNPFEEASSSNPFEEASTSNPFEVSISQGVPSPHTLSTAPSSRTAKVSAVKPRLVVPLKAGPAKAQRSSKESLTEDSEKLSITGYPASLTEKKRRAPRPPGPWASTQTKKPPPTPRAHPATPTQTDPPPLPPQRPAVAPRGLSFTSARARKGVDLSAGEPLPPQEKLKSSRKQGGDRGSAPDGQEKAGDAPSVTPRRSSSERETADGGSGEETAAMRTPEPATCTLKTPFDDDGEEDEELKEKENSTDEVKEGVSLGDSVPKDGRPEEELKETCPTAEQPVESEPLSRDSEAGTEQTLGGDDPFPGGQKKEERASEEETSAYGEREPLASTEKGFLAPVLVRSESLKTVASEGERSVDTCASEDGHSLMGALKKKKRAPLPPGSAGEGKVEGSQDAALPGQNPTQASDPTVTPPPPKPQRTAIGGKRRAPQPVGVAVSGGRTLLRARVSPSEAQPITGQSGSAQPITAQGSSSGGGAGGKVGGPASNPRRPHPVRPLESQPAASTTVGRDSSPGGVLEVTPGKTKVTEAVVGGAGGGPYSQLTQPELVSLVMRQQTQLSHKDSRIQELEEYIDNLLLRIIEEKPSILQSLSSTLRKAV
ncbi:hypothetical protein MATL_G00081970 [Megalops atlanticus]|uniref:Rab11 family-interacting protein 1 n=1 Tax=Megalops atlanticus TaxID=7932 RepID=A0A9D3Q5E3_MEGAT|nr:hypothetical protein MATL_G00081970 [Megalops atlanticus]